MRACVHCGVQIPPATRKDAKYCSILCGNRVRSLKHYRGNAESYKQKRALDNSNAPQRMHYRVKSRAKTNGIAFDIEISDIIIPDVCPVLGIPLQAHHGRKGYFKDSPSLDRINPTLGYVKGNVRVISARANLLKNDATLHELSLVLEDLRRINSQG